MDTEQVQIAKNLINKKKKDLPPCGKRCSSLWRSITVLDEKGNIDKIYNLDNIGRLKNKFNHLKKRNLQAVISQQFAEKIIQFTRSYNIMKLEKIYLESEHLQMEQPPPIEEEKEVYIPSFPVAFPPPIPEEDEQNDKIVRCGLFFD